MTRKKIFKSFSISLFLIAFFTLAVFLISPTGQAAAGETKLEVEYPQLATGAKITAKSDLSEYLKYVFDFGIFIGFFFILLILIWAGVLYFLSPAVPNALSEAKDKISGAISGLLIFSLLYLIITTINPYLAIFKTESLEETAIEEPDTSYPGVNFYENEGCSGISNTYTLSVDDLGDLKNKIYSVGIKHNTEQKAYYVAILYDITDYWGKCQYINPNTKCTTPVEPFAASASIYQYDFSPNGDGLYLYRKSFNQAQGKEENKNGGYLKVGNEQIASSGILILNLEKLKFTGTSSDYDNLKNCTVPEDEQDCAKYDEKGECKEKECPKLNKENISSIEIAGNYLVLLVYFKPGDTKDKWTYCQAYASSEDVNKNGPQQIKWDAIRNRGQDPNFIVIIPITK